MISEIECAKHRQVLQLAQSLPGLLSQISICELSTQVSCRTLKMAAECNRRARTLEVVSYTQPC